MQTIKSLDYLKIMFHPFISMGNLTDYFMQKVKAIFEELKEEFNKTLTSASPVIQWKPVPHSLKENYELHYAGGLLSIQAAGYLGAIQALQTIQIGIASQHLADFLGKVKPRFALRPLWLENSLLPALNDPEKLHVFCKKILQLGYNAVLLQDSGHLSVCNQLQDYGLKIILKPSIEKIRTVSPLNKLFKEEITAYLNKLKTDHIPFHYLFWESHWQHPEYARDPLAEDMVFPELVLAEAKAVESLLEEKQKLIFYLPVADEQSAKQCAAWMKRLTDDLSQKSILAFPAVAGDHRSDHLISHPFWNIYRQQTIPNSASIMPVVNVGALNHGEGIWPVIVQDLIDDYFTRGSHFLGIISTLGHLPKTGGINDCNLWIASQKMWNDLPSASLIETWFAAYRPDWNYSYNSLNIKQIRFISKQLYHLRTLTNEKSRDHYSSQDCRLMLESLLLQLNEIHLRLEKEERKRIKRSATPTLWDYFTYFNSDVKKMIMQIAQSCNATITNIFNENDSKESFWTEMSSTAGQGLQANARITILNSPNKGNPNSRMMEIYQENRLF
jgi:hypothetical protein